MCTAAAYVCAAAAFVYAAAAYVCTAAAYGCAAAVYEGVAAAYLSAAKGASSLCVQRENKAKLIPALLSLDLADLGIIISHVSIRSEKS